MLKWIWLLHVSADVSNKSSFDANLIHCGQLFIVNRIVLWMLLDLDRTCQELKRLQVFIVEKGEKWELGFATESVNGSGTSMLKVKQLSFSRWGIIGKSISWMSSSIYDYRNFQFQRECVVLKAISKPLSRLLRLVKNGTVWHEIVHGQGFLGHQNTESYWYEMKLWKIVKYKEKKVKNYWFIHK